MTDAVIISSYIHVRRERLAVVQLSSCRSSTFLPKQLWGNSFNPIGADDLTAVLEFKTADLKRLNRCFFLTYRRFPRLKAATLSTDVDS